MPRRSRTYRLLPPLPEPLPADPLDKHLHDVFIKRLNVQMVERGINRTELAAKIGCSPSLVSLWRKGRAIPTGEDLTKIARALSVDVVDLKSETPSDLRLVLQRQERIFDELHALRVVMQTILTAIQSLEVLEPDYPDSEVDDEKIDTTSGRFAFEGDDGPEDIDETSEPS
jgi:transcriptional regulator with XRE-family HTH domain